MTTFPYPFKQRLTKDTCSVALVSALRLRTLVSFAKTTDFTYDVVSTGLWSIIEMNVGILCACMPGIRALFKHIFPVALGSTRNRASRSYDINPRDIERRSGRLQKLFSQEQFSEAGLRCESIDLEDIEKSGRDRSSSNVSGAKWRIVRSLFCIFWIPLSHL